MSSPRSSTARKALSGTLRGDRLKVATGAPLARLPPAPRHLSPEARSAWSQFGRLAVALGTLTPADAGLLELLARTWASISELEKQLAADGLVLTSDSGARKAHPGLQAIDRARSLAHRLMGDLGLTPPGREKISIRPAHNPDNPFARFVRDKSPNPFDEF